jgi:phosphoribosylformylglycinamidine (FGAM) synthase-like enzyme
VSFYNQTGDVPIHPTPVVAVLGVIDDVAKRIPSGWQDEGNNIYLLGVTRDELDGSAWSEVIHDHLGGHPPVVDLAQERKLADLIRFGNEQNIISSAHDLADGGLAQALIESALRFGVGARVWLGEVLERDGVDLAAALFSESTGRVIVSVPREDDVRFAGLCEGRGYPVLRIGVTDSRDTFELQDVSRPASTSCAGAPLAAHQPLRSNNRRLTPVNPSAWIGHADCRGGVLKEWNTRTSAAPASLSPVSASAP